MLKIVADANIPYAHEAFCSLGEVRTCAGRGLRPVDVADADLLLVRSVTRVGSALLSGSHVRFVGTATIGVDHVDVDYLRRRGIGFASAPGCNANSVAEYVLSALFVLASRGHFRPSEQTVGVIGRGNVGSRVMQRVQTLGLRCLAYDPPLQERTGGGDFAALEEIFGADVITLHVPLTRDGPHPTFHMVDETFLRRMRPGSALINTARGSVVDEPALLRAQADTRNLPLVLDVHENEPNILWDLIPRTAIATPHIAGYSLDGKLRGTEMIYQAACRFLGRMPAWSGAEHLAAASSARKMIAPQHSDLEAVASSVLGCYDVRDDDRSLRALLDLAPAQRPIFFDALRKSYPPRREFSATELTVPPGRGALAERLCGLGFRVTDRAPGLARALGL